MKNLHRGGCSVRLKIQEFRVEAVRFMRLEARGIG